MKKLLLLTLLAGLSYSPFAQKLYFIYIQTEAGQAFFVKMDEKIQSSTADGYLIMPRLYDSTYNLTIGFPQNKWPEQKFVITTAAKDHGYLLKDFGAKGWGLFDLQSLAIIMNTGGAAINEIKARPSDSGATAFTRILAKAADDPSLLEKPVPELKIVVAEEKTVAPVLITETNKEPVTATVKTDPAPQKEEMAVEKKTEEVSKTVVTTEKTVPVNTMVKTDTVAQIKEEPKPVVIEEKPVLVKTDPDKLPVTENNSIKKSDSVIIKETTPEKLAVITEKPVEVKADTIQQKEIVIQPVTNTEKTEPVVVAMTDSTVKTAEVIKEEVYQPSVVKKQSESSTTEGFGLVFTDEYANGDKDTIILLIPNPKVVAKLVQEPVVEEKKFLDFATAPADTTMQNMQITKQVQPVTVVKNCTVIATDADFLKLRKRMAIVANNDDMIAEAKKIFRSKCFTVIQVKNLSALFLDEDGKYRFFDAAYLYVSDAENFPSLQAELKDEYYLNRFRAMLRN